MQKRRVPSARGRVIIVLWTGLLRWRPRGGPVPFPSVHPVNVAGRGFLTPSWHQRRTKNRPTAGTDKRRCRCIRVARGSVPVRLAPGPGRSPGPSAPGLQRNAAYPSLGRPPHPRGTGHASGVPPRWHAPCGLPRVLRPSAVRTTKKTPAHPPPDSAGLRPSRHNNTRPPARIRHTGPPLAPV